MSVVFKKYKILKLGDSSLKCGDVIRARGDYFTIEYRQPFLNNSLKCLSKIEKNKFGRYNTNRKVGYYMNLSTFVALRCQNSKE